MHTLIFACLYRIDHINHAVSHICSSGVFAHRVSDVLLSEIEAMS